jgi:hypothetical protein
MERELGRRLEYMLLVGKPKGKRSLGRPSCRWNDLEVTRWSDVDWSGVVQDRYKWRALVDATILFRVP